MKDLTNQIAKEILSDPKLIASVAKETKTCLFSRAHVSIYYGERTGLVITTQQNGWETRKPEINIHEKMTKKQVVAFLNDYLDPKF